MNTLLSEIYNKRLYKICPWHSPDNHHLTNQPINLVLLFFSTVVPYMSTVFSLVGKGAATGVFNGFWLYTTELFPTEVRTIGLGLVNSAARISGIVAPYVSGSMVCCILYLLYQANHNSDCCFCNGHGYGL